MFYQLDYTRIADSIFAANALQSILNPSVTLLGRHELPAIIQMEKMCLADILALVNTTGKHASDVDIDQGSFTLETSETARPFIEQKLAKMVLAKLQSEPYDVAKTVSTLLHLLTYPPLPRITPH